MAHQSLEDLKAENRANEEEEIKESEAKTLDDELSDELKSKEGESEVDDDPKEKEKTPEGESEIDDDDPEKKEKEPWEKSDEDDPDEEGGEAKFTGSDVAAAKRKLKGKLQEKTDEAEALAKENEELRKRLDQGGSQQEKDQGSPKMPRLADFNYVEEDFEKAMQSWVQQNAVAATQKVNSETSQVEAKKAAAEKVRSDVDNHYLRAEELAKKSGISEEVYAAADTEVRKTVEAVIPNGGEAVTDGLISRLGEGSEKVIYFLGRNQAKRAEFEKCLRDDPSGISAAMMLGQLKTDLGASRKKSSSAPAPSDRIQGDQGESQASSKLKRQYEATDDLQTRIDLKRSAKAKGIDVSGW